MPGYPMQIAPLRSVTTIAGYVSNLLHLSLPISVVICMPLWIFLINPFISVWYILAFVTNFKHYKTDKIFDPLSFTLNVSALLGLGFTILLRNQ